MGKTAKHKERKAKFRYILFSVFLIGFILFVLFRVIQTQKLPDSRYTVAVLSDPIHIISWDSAGDTFVILTIPQELRIEASHGYGMYPIKGLIALDDMEKRHGNLIQTSLEDSLGIPIHYLLDKKEILSYDDTDGYAILRHSFIFSDCISWFAKNSKTTIPWWLNFRLIIAARNVGASHVSLFSVDSVSDAVMLPDGEISGEDRMINTQKFDVMIGNAFEYEKVRNERLSVSVVNTTGVPGLAQKVARRIEKSGVYIVQTRSEDMHADFSCVLRGTAGTVQTTTAVFIRKFLDCSKEVIEEPERSDLTLIIGKKFLDRYLPYGK